MTIFFAVTHTTNVAVLDESVVTDHKVCSIFGDPHLVTFDGGYILHEYILFLISYIVYLYLIYYTIDVYINSLSTLVLTLVLALVLTLVED